MGILSSLINGAHSDWREGREHRRAERQRGEIPDAIYNENVRGYYNASNSNMFIVTQLELPCPFGYPWFGQKTIWAEDGYWQEQFNNMVLGKPSVYNCQIPLPPPYMGPAGRGNPPMPAIKFFGERQREWYKRHLKAGSLYDAFALQLKQKGINIFCCFRQNLFNFKFLFLRSVFAKDIFVKFWIREQYIASKFKLFLFNLQFCIASNQID